VERERKVPLLPGSCTLIEDILIFRIQAYVTYKLTPWLMEPGGTQGFSNNCYPE
jgi:hypothetical protein